jgi:lysophospholipase L1-like esterase
VIISLGTNDGPQVNTFQEILALRQFVSAARVFWILPANKPAVQDMIKIVAKNYKDTVLSIPELSKDQLHPTRQAYQELAKQTRIEKE